MVKFCKSIIFIISVLFIVSCGGGSKESGQLTGVLDRPAWKGINPYGMIYVGSGSLTVGQSDQDIASSYIQRPKTVSIVGFYMDETEITNNEYRQFTNWVKDSMAHTYMDNIIEDEEGNTQIDWDLELDWEDEILEDLFYQGEERLGGRKEFDVRQMIYSYEWINWQKTNARFEENRADVIEKTETAIFPDTLVWIRDFAYSYNEPMTRNYFWHPAYDDYPVVGVNWKMAEAFSHWRTAYWNKWDQSKDAMQIEKFRLPTEYEWEFAARGGKANAMYPWGLVYTRNAKGCLLANFKPGRGNYPEDGGYYAVKATAYFPNDYGLYNMAGNVAEWTSSAFVENAQSYTHDNNPDIRYNADENDPASYKRKVTRGGSWKDISYYIQTGTRNYEYQDTTNSYTGFRNVMTFLGRSVNDF